MHRSGTSLTASLLQSAGVDIGQRLMGAGNSNLKGHFEDLDFVEFHEGVLHSQGISKEGWTLQSSIQVQEQYLDKAKSIIQQRSLKSTWGWKDPRTILFLNFWHELIPEAKFLLIYRSPWEVVDSLYRRSDQVFHNNPNLAVDIWVNYNQAIIDFYDNFSDQCAILNIKQIALNPKSLLETVANKLDIPISSTASLYEQTLLNEQISNSHRPTLIKHYFTEAFDLYQQLNARAKQNDCALLSLDSSLDLESFKLPSYKAWVLQDWLEVRTLEREFKLSNSQLQQTQVELERSQVVITAMESSKFWQLRSLWFKFRSIFGLAEDSSLEASNLWSRAKYLFAVLRVKGLRYALVKLLKIVFQKLNTPRLPLKIPPEIPRSGDINYQKWLLKNYPNQAKLRKLAQTVETFSYKPVISLIVPVFNTPEHFLRQTIDSVLNQVYSYWELCLADDASTEPHIRLILEEYVSKDPRIKVVFRTENGHISHASNSAIEIATGEFIALLDHDDVLTPDALYEVALLLNRHPDADMIYSDEDKIDEHNQLRDPFFKPDWCPDSFLSRMYTCHLGTYRRSIANEIGGFRVGYEGSQDYDFVLRFTEKTENIFHIPKILYHWRMHTNSTASSLDSKNYAVEAAKKAISEAIHRRGEPGIVTAAPGSVDYHIVRYDIKHYDLVSIIIPTKNLGEMLDKCLSSIFKSTTYENYEVILIDNGSTEVQAIEVMNKWQAREPDKLKYYPLNIPFNYSRINNLAVKQAKGKYLLFLNNDTEVVTPDWINAMLEQAQRSSVGAVGALLLYPDNTIQHAGIVAGIGGVAGHSHKYFKVGSPGYFSHINTVNNFSAVTAACLMCRREIFEKVGGFEEELSVAFNDVDFCLKLVEKGYRNLYLPHVVLYHYESKSRGNDNSPSKLSRSLKEIEYMQNKWEYIIAHDPCYNPNLTRKIENYSIGI
ncbi:MAG: glycosyltransferase [Symploca sp. SIO2E9]|nr:glycosyltransferase [Symploca sp. SIO2E9]